MRCNIIIAIILFSYCLLATAQNNIVTVVGLKDIDDSRLNDFIEDYLCLRENIEPFMGFSIQNVNNGEIILCGNLVKNQIQNNQVYFLTHTFNTYTHILIRNGTALYIVNMRNPVKDILNEIKKLSFVNFNELSEIIMLLHKKNFYNKFQQIPEEMDSNGEWVEIEYDNNKW